MPFKPRGLEAQDHPLKHDFGYSCGLSAVTATKNSVWFPIVRSSTECTQANAKTIIVNPHNTAQDRETGAMCTPMSIIQNLNMNLNFSAQSLMTTDEIKELHGWWMPFFVAFGEKLDAADDDTGVTVAAIMELTKDDTNKDVVPLTTTKLDTTGTSALNHPVSTVNFTEVFGTLNYTTNIAMESADFDEDAFNVMRSTGTNRGALNACLGRKRFFTVGIAGSIPLNRRFNIRGFLPRAVRRIVDFGFFGILTHIPLISELSQAYTSDAALTADKAHIGVKMRIRYDEWNEHHDNTM